jgi:3-oxoacyl-[acyl-carrier-protein] synthase-3
MALIKYNNVQIKAISACVPKNINYNSDLSYLIPEEEIEKTINSIGIREKRFADNDVCSSDLCFKAAEKLIEDNDIERDSIDALIFLSQTPDYHQHTFFLLYQ